VKPAYPLDKKNGRGWIEQGLEKKKGTSGPKGAQGFHQRERRLIIRTERLGAINRGEAAKTINQKIEKPYCTSTVIRTGGGESKELD